MSNTKNHLNVISLGLAFGISWGIGLFILGILAWLFGYGTGLVNAIGTYLGYTPTFLGSIIGMIWGFIDCFIWGSNHSLTIQSFFRKK